MVLPKFKPPKIAKILKGANPLRQVLDDVREVIRTGREEIASVASVLKIEGVAPAKPVSSPVSIKGGAKEGTACNLCSSEHFSQVSGDLAEAMRFAREEGLKHPEVVRRVEHARQELNEMERYDLSSAEIERLPRAERVLADWALPRSRNLRHMINQAITTKEVGDLEKAAAEAERTAGEFVTRLWDLPKEEECEPCGELEDLKSYIERRRRG